jgi:hypothetical protein
MYNTAEKVPFNTLYFILNLTYLDVTPPLVERYRKKPHASVVHQRAESAEAGKEIFSRRGRFGTLEWNQVSNADSHYER